MLDRDNIAAKEFKKFTGGVLDTNCYLLHCPGGSILFDAPQGAARHFSQDPISLLLLTHGHFDHVADAAAIQREHGCRIAFHPDTAPMVKDADFFKRFGFELEIEPFEADFLLEEGKGRDLLGDVFEILHVPGHCPGSLCFYLPSKNAVVGGDVLFRGGVGRWDLPGGDRELLFRGIHQKILPLPESTLVLPGHGPLTTVGREKSENPYLQN